MAAEVPKGCPTNAPVVTETKEQLQQAVERVTTFPTTLDPRIFNNVSEVFDGQMRPDVREVSAGRKRPQTWVAWMASCPGACKLGMCNCVRAMNRAPFAPLACPQRCAAGSDCADGAQLCCDGAAPRVHP